MKGCTDQVYTRDPSISFSPCGHWRSVTGNWSCFWHWCAGTWPCFWHWCAGTSSDLWPPPPPPEAMPWCCPVLPRQLQLRPRGYQGTDQRLAGRGTSSAPCRGTCAWSCVVCSTPSGDSCSSSGCFRWWTPWTPSFGPGTQSRTRKDRVIVERIPGAKECISYILRLQVGKTKVCHDEPTL